MLKTFEKYVDLCGKLRSNAKSSQNTQGFFRVDFRESGKASRTRKAFTKSLAEQLFRNDVSDVDFPDFVKNREKCSDAA